MRNNQDRFGAKPEGSEAPPAKTLEFVKPSEFVLLPSKGAYPAGHPLHNKESIEIYYMTAKDEDILSSQALIKKGLAIERFIENVIVDKKILASSLYTGDRNAIIIAARASGYGNAYETEVGCPSCGTKNKMVFDLDKPVIKETSFSDPDKKLYKTDDGHFETIMPSSEYRVKFKLLTGKDELEMVEEKMSKKKTRIAGLERNITNQFKKMIVAIEGHEDRHLVGQYIGVMTAKDSIHLKKCYGMVNPNVEIKNHLECYSCGHEQELEVPLNADFFWPDT